MSTPAFDENKNWKMYSATSNVQYVSNSPPTTTGRGTATEPKRTNVNIEDPDEKMGLNKKYLISIRGLLRLAIIISLMGGWIAAAAAQKNERILNVLSDYRATRLAYIIIAVVGFALSIMFYIFFSINLDNIKALSKFNFGFIVLVCDVLFFIPMLALGITCAVREVEYNKRLFVPQAINKGAFAAASFFAFLTAVLYVISCIMEAITTFKIRSQNLAISRSQSR